MTILSLFSNTALALGAFTAIGGVYIYDNLQATVDFKTYKELHATAPSPFQVQSVTLGDNIGTAVIHQNGYSIEVAFDYEVVDDSNGVLGHSDVTIDISSLQINSMTNTATGKSYGDWTNREDIAQIIAQIRAYVDQNRLAQGV
jgi:hypothetical protein